MDYSRPVTAGSHVVVLRGGYRVQVTLARDIPDPQAAGIAEVLRYGPAEQDDEDIDGEEEGTLATQAPYGYAEEEQGEEDGADVVAENEEGDGDADEPDVIVPPAQLLTTSPAPARRTPAARKGPFPSSPAAIPQRRRPTPRKGPAATASNALPQQPRRAPRKGPPSSDPAALPTQAPPAPRPGQSQGPFNGLGPVNGTCDYCRSKKKGCDGSQQRPCTRCKGLGFSAAQCVNSGGKKTATPAKNKKRARKDDDEDDNGGDGPPPAKRGRGRPRKNQNQQAETQGDTNVQANHVGAAPVYSAADGVSAVAGRGIRVPVKVQRIRDEE